MSTYIVSPDMNLPIPVVGQAPGPDYADNVNSSLTLISQHDHTSGNGVLITPAAINLNSDLPFANNNATLLRSARFFAQTSPIGAAADVGALYVAGVDLYFNDISGNQIRLTQAGTIVGTAGSISGLPSGTASASYGLGTFVFQSATNTAANIDAASYIFRNGSMSSPGLTLQPPSLGADYSVTLPPPNALGQTGFLTYDISNNIGSTNADGVAQAMTSTGAFYIASAMTAGSADAIANVMSGSGANTIGQKITIPGADSIAQHMSAVGGDAVAFAMDVSGGNQVGTIMGAAGANSVVGKVNSTSSGCEWS